MGAGTPARSFLVGIALGLIWPTALAVFFTLVSVAQLAQAAYNLALVDITGVQWILRVGDAVLCSAMLGALFGIPLGLVARARVITAWIAFLMAYVVICVISATRTPFGVGIVVLEWSFPETWLYVLAVLAFARLASHLAAKRSDRPDSPRLRFWKSVASFAVTVMFIALGVHAAMESLRYDWPDYLYR